MLRITIQESAQASTFKLEGKLTITQHDLCRFVPLVGEAGWEAD